MATVLKPGASHVRRTVVVCVALLIATGCSGDDGSSAAPTSSPTSTGPSITVPQGVTLTDPGSTLRIGDAASAIYADDQRVSVLTVTVSRVVKGSIKDFRSFVLSAAQRRSMPYYVSATVTNDGPRQLGQIEVPLYGFDSTDTAFPATSLVGALDRCSDAPLPTGFAPDQTVKTCLIYLVPPEATLQAVQLRTNDSADPISWAVR